MCRLANNIKIEDNPKRNQKKKIFLKFLNQLAWKQLPHKRVTGINFFIHLGEWFFFFLFYFLGRFVYFSHTIL